MKKTLLALITLLFPILGFAASNSSSMSLAPPPGDFSVVFLGNIFGVVDGVLHGTGSQIFGTMFGVFNAGVLALGGIVIMYIMIVGTMNTAQEGKMLGQRWSSIWIPLRATLGLALLIPKASGYCLMQIVVMWIVLQGVGLADKIWNAALSYLNRGGVIVQTQMAPEVSLQAGGGDVSTGASVILSGQVCMLGIQAALTEQQNQYNQAKSASSPSGPCAGTTTEPMTSFCNQPVPDFIASVNVVQTQSNNPNATSYTVQMPSNLQGAYAFLNGICGTIAWNAIDQSQLNTVQQNITTLSANELNTVSMSRAIAIQQMYQDLSSVAREMVSNLPGSQTNSSGSSTQADFSTVAVQQFGIPLLNTGVPCTAVSAQCVMWGSDPSTPNPTAPLLTGTEFLGAISDYNAVMLPTLNLMTQAQKGTTANASRTFIDSATQSGWIMAGSYFYDLAKLSDISISSSNLTDQNTGLSKSTFDPNTMTQPFDNGSCSGTYQSLCIWLQKNSTPIDTVVSLINGTSILEFPLQSPSVSLAGHQAMSGIAASTTFGYINNSVMVNLPGQPGLAPPQFIMNIDLVITPSLTTLPKQNFPCGWMLVICLGRLMGDIIYNIIIRNLFRLFMGIIMPIVNEALMLFLTVPLMTFAGIFLKGVEIIEQPSVNPIIALSAMGVSYINYASDMWITLMTFAITNILIPETGIFIIPLLGMAMPLLLSWIGVMMGIGFITAYYTPFVPYMIFTFGTIAWLMAVIEAMVAAPIAALGISHPEGHDALGKGNDALMILMNVFLRPALMIIGYITAIALSYVSVWIINAGFGHMMQIIQGSQSNIIGQQSYGMTERDQTAAAGQTGDVSSTANFTKSTSGYSTWAGIYGFFFCIIIYTSMYLTVVQKAFSLIAVLPDKVLRWIGGQQENIGQDAAGWGEDTKRQVSDATKEAQSGQKQSSDFATGWAKDKAAKKAESLKNLQTPEITSKPGQPGGGESNPGSSGGNEPKP